VRSADDLLSALDGAPRAGGAPGGGALLRRRLWVPAVLLPVAETALLLAVGPHGAAALGPQITAPPPLDLLHDLRWVATYHDSWLSLGLELAAILALRSLYAAWIVRRAWRQGSGAAPSLVGAAGRALVFYATASILLWPWVALLFGGAISHLSYLYFAALPPALAVALVLHRGALSRPGQPWWWRPTRRTAAWEAGSLAWLTAAGALISSTPAPVALVAAAVAGALNARATEAIAASAGQASQARARRRRVQKALTPVAVAAIFAAVVGGTGIGFATIRQGVPDLRRASIPYRAVGHPVLVASGFNSRWGPPPALALPDGFVIWRYSYRGLNPAGELLPYTPADTQQSLLVSATRLGWQVQALHRAYGQPVTLVAESEGALVARTYLLRRYRPQTRAVDRVVLLDMPQGQPHVSFPHPGQDGWGVGTGWVLRGLISLIGNLGPLTASADAPFSRDLISRPRLLAALALAPPPPGVQQVWVEALADAVTQPYPHTRTLRGSNSPTIVVPAPHGGLIRNPAVQRIIAGVLAGTALPDPQPAAALQHVLAAAASAWQVPSLPWHLQHEPATG
jgi:hypothetical protein